ncbi:MAG: ribonucleoside-diphosphate reductase subunit alpha, partial [Chloroflexota bacterium]|nr:ribonucleoside-diphosphate reductase subunit alpha [Chloroflexota bacterium]
SEVYRERFTAYLREAVRAGRLDPELLELDLGRLSAALEPERDGAFTYIGLQTVYDRYLIDIEGRRVELPQYFWMRVAMGIALREEEPEARAMEFYETLSSFRFVSATPTLFNSGTLHPQLSSCYLTTVGDDLSAIFKAIGDNAMLSKWAGGLGNDWTPVRATGSYIQGTHGHGQGVIPFLKIVSDTAVAVNQGGKRKGAVCSYLETWHLDIEDFLELRKNTGDERRRTHDMHTANWIPDLFMKRVRDGAHWTLFSPNETPDLHDLYGRAFEERYEEYERLALEGHLRQHKRVDALGLWRKMLSMLFETGHPWMTWKDPSNLRSPQDHAGVVHNSNLCTEILLNTSAEETAVCNLGSVNLAAHTGVHGLDGEMLATTVRTGVRMLDNVININYYPTPEAHTANLRHRPVGLGVMGFQDTLHKLRLSYASAEAVELADRSMELVSYHAILASAELAEERGCYPSYEGSKWSRGVLPIDTLDLVEIERGGELDVDRTISLDWTPVREAVARTGMRNSNVLAIAPTATISNISGVSQSIEPNYRNLFAKSNLSGDFTVINPYLVADLKVLGLWDADMLDALKYYDGSVQEIEAIPEELKLLYRTAAEIEPEWLIEAASRRQKWIDMGQSLNLYISEPDGRKLHEMYFLAWRKGLKTTYYLRSVGATQVEKSSTDVNRRGLQPRWMKNRSASSRIEVAREASPKACSITDPGCEACQ